MSLTSSIVASAFLRGGQRRSQRGLFHGVQVGFGNTISFSHIKTRRKFRPNIRRKHLYSEVLDRYIHINVSTKALRTMDASGGFDRYILNTPPAKLQSQRGERLRSLMLQRIEELANVMDDNLIASQHLFAAAPKTFTERPTPYKLALSRHAHWNRELSLQPMPSPLIAEPPVDPFVAYTLLDGQRTDRVPVSELLLSVRQVRPVFKPDKMFQSVFPELAKKIQSKYVHDNGHSSLNSKGEVANNRRKPIVRGRQYKIRPTPNLDKQKALELQKTVPRTSPFSKEYVQQQPVPLPQSKVIVNDVEFQGPEIVRSAYVVKLDNNVSQILTPSLARIVEMQRLRVRRPLLSTLWWNRQMNGGKITFNLTPKGLQVVEAKLSEAARVFEKQSLYLTFAQEAAANRALAAAEEIPSRIAAAERAWKQHCESYKQSVASKETWVPPASIVLPEVLDQTLQFYFATFTMMQDRSDTMSVDQVYKVIAAALDASLGTGETSASDSRKTMSG